MLTWAILFLVLALIAAIFGFGGIASAFAGIAQILFVPRLCHTRRIIAVGRRSKKFHPNNI